MANQHVSLTLIGSMARTSSVDSEPLISVVIAVFNSVKTFMRCIDSVSRQTYKNHELIVIDGGSTDGTRDLIEKNIKLITYWESEKDRGIYHAWNKALQVARGEWIYFLGADDYFANRNVLAHVTRYIRQAPQTQRVMYGRVIQVREDGSVIGTLGSRWDRKRFFQEMTIPHQGIFHHRSLFRDHGQFNEQFEIAGDYEFLLRELKSGDPGFIADITVAAMQYGGKSSHGSHSIKTLQEIRRARNLNGVKVVPALWLWALVKAHMRRLLERCLGENRAEWIRNVYRRITLRQPI